jgi:hypothetical protein
VRKGRNGRASSGACAMQRDRNLCLRRKVKGKKREARLCSVSICLHGSTEKVFILMTSLIMWTQQIWMLGFPFYQS